MLATRGEHDGRNGIRRKDLRAIPTQRSTVRRNDLPQEFRNHVQALINGKQPQR